jgi:hypothetical protein
MVFSLLKTFLGGIKMMIEKKRDNEVREKPLIARAWQEGQGEYFPKSHRTLI